ncbi:MAG: carboxypeptidase regulatory-like domain-containing protein [Planctomycetes bacterium]|nr:carboxypeptidase regulatory-like domain-containing protein [Planctomycetota bacterium]
MKTLMLLLCLGLLLPLAVAQEEKVDIAGVVKDLRDGHALAGVEVQVQGVVRRGAARDPLATATTDAAGCYLMVGVDKARARTLFFAAPGYARGMERLQAGAWNDLQTHLAPGADVVGTVVHAASGAPLAKASVESEMLRATADEQGRFVLAGVPLDGEALSFTVSAEGFVPQEVTVSGQELARTGRAALRIPLEAGHAAVAAVHDAKGAPIEGAVVRARPLKAVPYSGLERANYSAKTDARGIAVVRGLPRNEAVVLEASHGELLATQSDPVVAQPDPADGPEKLAAVISLSAGHSATVRVVEWPPHAAAGYPVSGARVELQPLVEGLQDFAGFVERDTVRGAVQYGTTDAQGNARFSALPAQAITVEASLAGHESTLAILHAEKDATELLLTLTRGPQAPPNVPWFVTIDDAWRAADAMRLPVLFTMAMDGERANDHIAQAHFKDPEVCKTLGAMPVLLSNVFGKDGVHAGGVKHDEVNGECTRYGGIACAAHQAVEAYCLDNFGLRGTSFQVPRQIFVTPQGEVLEHRVYYLTERDLQRLAMRSLRRVNPQAAFKLGVKRLPESWKLLRSAESHAFPAADDLVRLVNSGDEHAIALMAGFSLPGVVAATRMRVLESIRVEALFAAGSALAPFLADADANIRVHAAAKLAAVADAVEVADVLLPCLRDPDARVAAAVEAALGVRRDGVLRLTAQLAPALQVSVMTALLRQTAVQHLPGLRAVLTNASTAERARLLRALASRSATDTEALALVLNAVRATDQAVLGALHLLQPQECSASQQAELLEVATQLSAHESGAWRLAALRLLLRCGADVAVPRAALHDADSEVCFEAALDLLARGERDAAHFVLDRVDDACHARRSRAALCALTKSDDPGSANAWRDLLCAQGIIEN